MIMIDIDNFKKINDKYGHSCGDEVIRSAADLMKSFFRGTDIIGRIGGEEFSVVMLNTKSDKAYAKAEALRIEIEQMNFEYNEQKIHCDSQFGNC